MGNFMTAGKGKQSSRRINEQDFAVLELKQQRDKLKQYQKKIGLQLEQERKLAKRLLAQKKIEKAKLLLKKKRFQEQLLLKTDGQLDNIEKMVSDIEFAQIEVKVIEGIKMGNDSLKKMNQILSIENVERILEETQEAVDYQNEINSLLAGSLSLEDEEAVLEEFEQIKKEMEFVNLPDIPVNLPDIPVNLPDIPVNLPNDQPDDDQPNDLPDIPNDQPLTIPQGKNVKSKREIADLPLKS